MLSHLMFVLPCVSHPLSMGAIYMRRPLRHKPSPDPSLYMTDSKGDTRAYRGALYPTHSTTRYATTQV